MAGDGVSIPTNIAQLGSVAKTQAKSQHQAQPAAPFADQLDKSEDLKTQRVKEMQKAEQQAINPDEEREKDKRRRRRMRRNRKGQDEGEDQEEQKAGEDEEDEANQDQVGRLIDFRV